MTGLIFMVAFVLACDTKATIGPTEGDSMEGKTIHQVLTDDTDQLMSLTGVVGTAEGECSGKPCIRVLVVEKTEELLKRIPPVIEGYQVTIFEVGDIKALDETD